MAYSDFTLKDLKLKFNIANRVTDLFPPNTVELQPDIYLQQSLQLAKKLPVKSEKARSELIVMPVLLDMMQKNADYFTIYSGESLIADKSEGLTGECDFILTKNTQSFDINIPIFSIVEAKKNDVETGIPQCAAQMIGAKMYNEQYGNELKHIYGCVTTADEWKFLKLDENQILIDNRKYYLVELPELLGVFQFIIDYYKGLLN